MAQIAPFRALRFTEKAGDPNASRAVANASGMNKIALIVPCHRVIGANGTLTGYAGGLERKRFVLDLEKGIHSTSTTFPKLT